MRQLQERGEEIEVTHHGRMIARLVPVRPTASRPRAAEAWSTLERVAREIGARWPRGRTATAAVREGRRAL